MTTTAPPRPAEAQRAPVDVGRQRLPGEGLVRGIWSATLLTVAALTIVVAAIALWRLI